MNNQYKKKTKKINLPQRLRDVLSRHTSREAGHNLMCLIRSTFHFFGAFAYNQVPYLPNTHNKTINIALGKLFFYWDRGFSR